MTIALSTTVVPAVFNMFDTLDHLLVKAAARCEATKTSESVYLGWRIAPDMHPLSTQFRFATEIPARSLSRIAGAELPTFGDSEATFADFRERVARAREIVEGLDSAALDADPHADITVPMGPDRKVTMPRAAFANQWVMPNLYFHTTAAYLILRGLGLDIGKKDFLTALASRIS